MSRVRFCCLAAFLTLLAFAGIVWSSKVEAANARPVIIGVNVVGVDLASDQAQDALLADLQRYGVKTIRTALGGHGDRYTSFVIKAYQHGIGSVVMLDPCANGTGKHTLSADAAAGRPWGVAALSDGDPNGFAKWFGPLLDKLDAAKVRITAFELGNELNTPRFNGDFRPELTTHRGLTLADLNNPKDQEASTVAGGYHVYVKVMAKLKEMRDRSPVNKTTPILTAMSADMGPTGALKKDSGISDFAGIPDSIEYLRQIGVDGLADGYAVHVYPTWDRAVPAQARAKMLEQEILSSCKAGTKPCWITEWGLNNNTQGCPLKDEDYRATVVKEERDAFQQFAQQGRLAAILYYSWSGLMPPSWQKTPSKEEPLSIYRCGGLTDAGRLALAPM